MSDEQRHTHIMNVPAGTRVTIEEEAAPRRGPGWFRMFRPIVRTGIWARLSSAAKAVYPVLAERADDNWIARVPYRQPRELRGTSRSFGLVELSGLSIASVERAMRELRESNLVIVRQDGRGRDCGVYQLVPPVGNKDITTDGFKPSRVMGSKSPIDGFNPSIVRGSQNIERGREVSDTSLRDSSDSGRLTDRSAALPVAEMAGAAAAAMLLKSGQVTAREALELAELADGSIERCQRALNYLRSLDSRGMRHGTPYGCIRAAIVGDYPDRGDQHARNAAAQRVDDDQRERNEQRRLWIAEQADGKRRLEQIRHRLSRMPAADLQLIVAETIAHMPRISQRLLPHRDPMTSDLLAWAVGERLQQVATVD